MNTIFQQLNIDWNAEPNGPEPHVTHEGDNLTLEFLLNAFLFPQFNEGDKGVLRFTRCWRYRLGATNDEGWYRGQCRFSRVAPAWGEFYQVSGNLLFDREPTDWVMLSAKKSDSKHYLFYLRDETFECDAATWSFTVVPY